MGWRRVGRWIFACCAVAIAGCTDSSEVTTPTSNEAGEIGPSTTPDITTTGVVVFDEEVGIDVGSISDLGGSGYECFGQLPFTDLFVIDDRPALSDGDFASLERIVELGKADDWIEFPNGVRMQREPLSGIAPQPMLVMPPHATQPTTCTPFWLTSADSIAFQVLAEPSADVAAVISIENCRDPEAVEVGLRVFENDAVLWLWSREFADSCEVDGSVTMEIDLPPGLDQILSGQRWPFGPPLLSGWYQYREAFPEGIEAPARPPIEIECSTDAQPAGNVVTWTGRPWDVTVSVVAVDGEFRSGSQAWGELDVVEAEIGRELWLLRNRLVELGNPVDLPIPVPYRLRQDEDGGVFDDSAITGVARAYVLTATRGDESITVDCGSATVRFELPPLVCTVQVNNFVPRIAPSLLGAGIFFRDGLQIDLTSTINGLIDTDVAPGETYTYTYEVTDTTGRGRPARTTKCGTVTIPEEADLVTTLTVGAREFGDRLAAPYVYFTIVTDGVERDFRMEPQNSSIVFVDPPIDMAAIDPRTLHQRLLAAIADGDDVTAVVDRVSGLPTQWSIDGQSWELSCFSIDNRPPELRDGPCDPVFDIISTN